MILGTELVDLDLLFVMLKMTLIEQPEHFRIREREKIRSLDV